MWLMAKWGKIGLIWKNYRLSRKNFMLFVITGTDYSQRRRATDKLMAVLKKKRPEAEYFRLTKENFSFRKLEELSQSQGLFEQKLIVLLDELGDDKERKEALMEVAPRLGRSNSAFVITEEKFNKKERQLLEGSAHSYKQVGGGQKTQRFSPFKVADALAKKDRRNLWVAYQQALRAGLSAEELFGTLFWQIKALLLVAKSSSREDTGLKSYAYRKAQGNLKDWQVQELEAFQLDMATIYHEARQGKSNLHLLLEERLLAV